MLGIFRIKEDTRQITTKQVSRRGGSNKNVNYIHYALHIHFLYFYLDTLLTVAAARSITCADSKYTFHINSLET